VNYSSTTREHEGKKDTNEVFEMRKPDYHMEARRVPGQDVFDVNVKCNDPQGNITTENKQYSLPQLQESVHQNLRDHPTGDYFANLMNQLPTEPLDQDQNIWKLNHQRVQLHNTEKESIEKLKKEINHNNLKRSEIYQSIDNKCKYLMTLIMNSREWKKK